MRRLSVLCALLWHTGIAAAAISVVWFVRAGQPAGTGASVALATAMAAPADIVPPDAEPGPARPAPPDARVPLPDDPPPPDDSLADAPADTPTRAAPSWRRPDRDWAAMRDTWDLRCAPTRAGTIEAPRPLLRPPPAYPADAARAGATGTVRLAVLVATNGSVAAVRIAASSGSAALDRAAVAAAMGWRFAPARRDGRAIAVWVEAPVSFRL